MSSITISMYGDIQDLRIEATQQENSSAINIKVIDTSENRYLTGFIIRDTELVEFAHLIINNMVVDDARSSIKWW